MRRLVCLLALWAMLGCSALFASTIQVVATGDCSQDLNNVRNAVYGAVAGDEIQLVPGTANVFNMACAVNDGGPGIFVGTPDISITAPNGPVVFQGPGSADPNQLAGIIVTADGFRMDGVTVRGWYFGVLSFPGNGQTVHNSSVSNGRFEDNIMGYEATVGVTGTYLTNNTFLLPHPPSMDPTSPFFLVIGAIWVNSNHSVVSGNTLIGPGQLSHFTSASQLVSGPSATQVPIHSVGLWQIDYIPPASRYSLIANNTLSGLDAGIQSSSDYGVTSENTVTNCAIGITLSNDTDDGVTAVHGHIVTQNVSTHNDVGLWMASAQDSTISLNDFTNDSLAGMLFLANPGGANSTGNKFVQDSGSKMGVSGNQGRLVAPPKR